MTLPTVTANLAVLLPDGTQTRLINYRPTVKVRYELVSDKPSLDGANTEYVRFRPEPRNSFYARTGSSGNNTYLPYHGFFQTQEVAGVFSGTAVLLKNQVFDINSYYRLTTWFFKEVDVNLFFDVQFTAEADVAIMGSNGRFKYSKCYSIPSSAPATINMKDYRI